MQIEKKIFFNNNIQNWLEIIGGSNEITLIKLLAYAVTYDAASTGFGSFEVNVLLDQASGVPQLASGSQLDKVLEEVDACNGTRVELSANAA